MERLLPRLLLLLLCLSAAGARGDVLTNAQQRQFVVESATFINVAGKAHFLVRQAGDAPGADLHPVESDNIKQIEFGTDDSPSGRRASGIMADGRRFADVVIISATNVDGALLFLVRMHGETAATPLHRVGMREIARIDFGEALPPLPKATPTPAPTPPEEERPAWRRPKTDPAEKYRREDPMMAPIVEPLDTNTLSRRLNMPRFLTAHYMIVDLNLAIDVFSYLVFLVLATAIGGTFLYTSSRVEDIDDFPMWKAYVTAGAISIIAPLVFRIVAFIPVFGFVLGLLAFIFTTRAIIMGAMEVLEDKANQVLVTFLVIQFGGIIGIALLLNKAI